MSDSAPHNGPAARGAQGRHAPSAPAGAIGVPAWCCFRALADAGAEILARAEGGPAGSMKVQLPVARI